MTYKEKAEDLIKKLDIYPTMGTKERLLAKDDIAVFVIYEVLQGNDWVAFQAFRSGWYRAKGATEYIKAYSEDYEILGSFCEYRFHKNVREVLSDYVAGIDREVNRFHKNVREVLSDYVADTDREEK